MKKLDINKLYKFNEVSVLVAGDLMLDDYISGNVQRISPEAPVPILNVNSEKRKLGGAGNVVNNLTTLSANTRVLSCIGQDGNGSELLEILKQKGADVRFVMQAANISTTTKTRIVARNQQVVRLDRETAGSHLTDFIDYVKENIGQIFSKIDVVVLSDYGKGVLSDEICQLLISQAKKNSIPVFVDPKGRKWKKYTGRFMERIKK